MADARYEAESPSDNRALLMSAGLAGIMRSTQREYPRVSMSVVDADPAKEALVALHDAVYQELGQLDGELEVAHRDGVRLVRRYSEISRAE